VRARRIAASKRRINSPSRRDDILASIAATDAASALCLREGGLARTKAGAGDES
jgi:hypothetical protein